MRKVRPLLPRPSNAPRGRDVDQHLDRNALDNAHRSPKEFTGSDPIPMIEANTRLLARLDRAAFGSPVTVAWGVAQISARTIPASRSPAEFRRPSFPWSPVRTAPARTGRGAAPSSP